MSRLPWFAFFPSDWFRDTRCLSLAARGAWIDLLGILWDSKTRGTKSLEMKDWASELGKPLGQVKAVFQELAKHEISTMVTNGNGAVTVSCRRQLRDEKARESTRLRVQRHRKSECNAASNASDTVQKSEVRSQKSESESESGKNEEKKERKEKKEIKISTTRRVRGGNVSIEVKESKSEATWLAYSHAYLVRYRVFPVRDALANTSLCKLVDRLGKAEAPLVAAFYLDLNDGYYLGKRHPPDLLARDAPGLRTQWATGIKATRLEGKSAEQQDAVVEQVKRVRALMQEGEGHGST